VLLPRALRRAVGPFFLVGFEVVACCRLARARRGVGRSRRRQGRVGERMTDRRGRVPDELLVRGDARPERRAIDAELVEPA